MKTIKDYNFSGKKAIIRADFNVPLDKSYNITDYSRIRATLPTIEKVLEDGGSAILVSHLGRPKEGPEDKYSLRHIVVHMGNLLNREVKFADDCIGDSAIEKAKELKPGEVLLLENVRFYKEETKGDKEFAKKLASLGDVFVNDAFGAVHRAHASTTVIAEFFQENKMFGHLLSRELKSIDKVLSDIKRPYVAVIGGAKVSTKIDVLNNLIDKADDIIIGGGMMFTFIKAQGGKTGDSLIENDYLETARNILSYAKTKGTKIHLPIDTVIADEFSNEANIKSCNSDQIPDGWMGMDIGEKASQHFSAIIEASNNVLWNGPMGVTEMPNFASGTEAVVKAMVKATEKGAFTLVGGGDSVSAISQLGMDDQVSYVSTGGGALLEYMEGKELPGIKAIQE